MKALLTVIVGVYYRLEARALLLSLHMGHCIVMGEALLGSRRSTGGSQDWHIFTFQNILCDKAPEHAAHAEVPHRRC